MARLWEHSVYLSLLRYHGNVKLCEQHTVELQQPKYII